MLEERLKAIASKLALPEENAKIIYSTLMNEYKKKHPDEKEETSQETVLKIFEARIKKMTVFAGSKEEVFLVFGEDVVRDYLNSVREDATEQLRQDISIAVQRNMATPEGKVLDHRQTFGNNRPNPAFRKEIGCAICLPLIEQREWEVLLKNRSVLKEQGCNCLQPRIYKRAFGLIKEDGVIKKAVVTFLDLASLQPLNLLSTYKIGFVKSGSSEDLITGRSNAEPILMPEEKVPDIKAVVNGIPGLFTTYTDLEIWFKANEDKWDRWFITEVNIASVSPTTSQAGNRMIQFDDFEQLEKFDIPVYVGYIPEDIFIKSGIAIGSRIFLVGNLFEAKNQDGMVEKRLMIYNIIPLTPAPSINLMGG